MFEPTLQKHIRFAINFESVLHLDPPPSKSDTRQGIYMHGAFSISYNIYQIISLQDLYFRGKTDIGNENCSIFMWIQFVNCERI